MAQMPATHAKPWLKLHLQDRPAVTDRGVAPYALSTALAIVAAAAAGLSLFFPSLLHGTDVLDGNLRGTALVVLVVGVPLLVGSMVRTSHGSARAVVGWLGAVVFLLYQAMMFCFATPLNNLFLLYVAYLGLAVWSAVALLAHTDLPGFVARVDHRMPVRALAVAVAVLYALDAAAWLARILPDVFTATPAAGLEGSGLTTNPVWIQDLALWVPAAGLAAFWLWRRRPWGLLLAPALVLFFAIECVSIAMDQWWGYRADPHTDWAVLSMVPAFLALAVVSAAPLAWWARNVDRH